MSTIVEATLPASQFALNSTFQRHPSTQFEMFRMAASGVERPIPFMWVSGENHEELLDTIQRDPSVENVDVLADLDDEWLLRMEWVAHIRVILYIVLEEDATVMNAVGRNGTWRFKIFFPEHDSVSATYEFCEDHGIDLQFERISQLSESRRGDEYGLSDNQYQVLVNAYEHDYYKVPRAVNLQELASDLDVSHQALSECLRRGHETLIANSLRPETNATLRP